MDKSMKNKLIVEAKKIVGNFDFNSFDGNCAGIVACALLADNGKIYTGICINLACGLGFCAEASAIADMLKDRETKIQMIVALTEKGNVIPPCGRCRELLYQVNVENLDTQIIIEDEKVVSLRDLLPHTWANVF